MKIDFKKIFIAFLWIVIIGILLYFGIQLFSPDKTNPLPNDVLTTIPERL